MADTVTTPNMNTTTSAGGVNYSDYESKLAKAVASTRDTKTADDKALSSASKAASQLTGTYKDVGQAAVSNFETASKANKAQAEKAAMALEMAGSASLQTAKNIEEIQSQLKTQVKSASESWDRASQKADEYVSAASKRVTDMLNKLDTIHSQFGKERNFAKAHDMQVAVQSTLGSMKTEERNILEVYGADSAEYKQFQSSKMSALATVQSNIHSSYQQLREQQNQTYLNAVSDVYTKGNMYLGYQEQQSVEMVKYADEAKASYELQATQLNVALEAAKGTAIENVANWIIETPEFTMDMTPLMTLVSDLYSTQQANELATAQFEQGKYEFGKNLGMSQMALGLQGLRSGVSMKFA